MRPGMLSVRLRPEIILAVVYANNHYAGHGPTAVTQFLSIWETDD